MSVPSRELAGRGSFAPGPIALIGGCEHLPGCEAIDRWLLAATGAQRPVVTVVPLASSIRTHGRAVERARRWWRELGVEAVIAGPTAAERDRSIERADIIVLTGGVPDRLYARLAGSATWDLILERWRQGAALSGSSSGAMVMASHRQSVRPPFKVRPGFGLIANCAVAPHHELSVPRWVAERRAVQLPGIAIIGVDERTALIRTRSDEFRVVGSGGVTILNDQRSEHFPHGTVVDLTPYGCRTVVPPISPIDRASLRDVVDQRSVIDRGDAVAPNRRVETDDLPEDGPLSAV
ncbi:MAG: Type 1 glutamine amidotransferase-like domain-containing protein [Nitriliruptoraceae bacterium]